MAKVEQLVLASTSPWRHRILREAGIDALPVAPEVDESLYSADNPVALAAKLARAKAAAVWERMPESLVLGADQVVFLDGEIFGKPGGREAHLEQLKKLRGRVHSLVTAVALLSRSGEICFETQTRIQFRGDLTDSELEAYVDSGEGRQCAGGYQVEGKGAWMIERVDGDWFNVVGLPVLDVISALRQRGWRVPLVAEQPSGG